MDRDKKKIKRGIGVAILIGFIIISSSYGYIRNHTFTLTGEGMVKDGQIQPVIGKVKVSGNVDTDVVFTDTESGEQYTIGYITQGVSETIQFERGKWYRVEGAGKLTMGPVNVRLK